MPKVKIKDIIVKPRFRTRFIDIDKLAESIKVNGLIHSIILDEDNALIAGERRLKAHKHLRLNEIEVTYRKDLTEVQKKEMELEENIQRNAFTWQEEVTAKSQLHKLKQQIHGAAVKGHSSESWGMKDTATALGESIGSTSMDIQLARGIKVFPQLMSEKTKSTAFKKMKQLQEALLQEELAKRLKQRGITDKPDIIHGDCVVKMSKMDAGSVDLIFADPPFGIDLDKAQSFSEQRVYQDDEYTILDMLDKAIPQMFRVLKDNRHAYIFCAIQNFYRIREIIVKAGFQSSMIPIIWDKGKGTYPSQSVTFTVSYETAIFCWKGKRLLNGTPRDIFPIKGVPPQHKIHVAEKPTELLRTFIKLSSLPGEVVLDPFAGSGSTLQACKETNRRGIGIELDAVNHRKIVERLEGVENGTDDDVSE